jgi:large subunit ribosomal protein L35
MSQRRQLVSLTRSISRQRTAYSRAASTSAQAWTRPIAEGVNPAYDAALELLDGHSQKLLQRAEALRSQSGRTDAETAELQRKAKQLELEARIIDPRLRSTFTSMQEIGQDVEEGEADALRTLAERKWRKEGRLDRLVRYLSTSAILLFAS